eukprot:763403-Hanusia_phi.AAC.8
MLNHVTDRDEFSVLDVVHTNDSRENPEAFTSHIRSYLGANDQETNVESVSPCVYTAYQEQDDASDMLPIYSNQARAK